MSVKERLREFINFKKLSERAFCKEVGLSSTYINSMRVSIQPRKVQMIAVRFPELNLGWLLANEGTMLKGDNDNILNEPHFEYQSIDALNRVINNLANINDRLSRENEQLREELEKFKKFRDAKMEVVEDAANG